MTRIPSVCIVGIEIFRVSRIKIVDKVCLYDIALNFIFLRLLGEMKSFQSTLILRFRERVIYVRWSFIWRPSSGVCRLSEPAFIPSCSWKPSSILFVVCLQCQRKVPILTSSSEYQDVFYKKLRPNLYSCITSHRI